jgi:hypothetical protein
MRQCDDCERRITFDDTRYRLEPRGEFVDRLCPSCAAKRDAEDERLTIGKRM